MKVIIINNTSVRGKSFAANTNKVVDLNDDDAQALINAGKAIRAPGKTAEKKPGK